MIDYIFGDQSRDDDVLIFRENLEHNYPGNKKYSIRSDFASVRDDTSVCKNGPATKISLFWRSVGPLSSLFFKKDEDKKTEVQGFS